MPCCILAAAVFGLVLRRRARRAQHASGTAPVAAWAYEDASVTGGRVKAAAASARGGA